jgi:phospholipase/lecithinase/hemolysin
MKKALAASCFVAVLAHSALPASAYTPLFAFGDSLSDAGNLFQVTGSPPFPYFMGHSSNGLTWVEDLSLQLNLGQLTPSLLGGNDFAFAGAQSGKTDANPDFLLGTTTPNPTRMFDLDAQVAAYHNAHPDPVPDSLYALDIGANDIAAAFTTFPTNPSEITTVVSQAVTNTISAVMDLYDDGARDLLFYEVPDLGLTPLVFGTPQQNLVSGIALTFNQAVLTGLAALNAPDLKVFDLQTFGLFDEIVGDPMAFGFNPTTIHDACLDAATGAPCSTLPAVQNTYLFWDDVHPTERGHSITASFAYALVAPEPATWAMMLVSFIGLVLAGSHARAQRTDMSADLRVDRECY